MTLADNAKHKKYDSLEHALKAVRKWANGTSQQEPDLGTLLKPEVKALRDLIGALQNCTMKRFQEVIDAWVDDYRETVLSDLDNARRREAMVRVPLDVHSLIPRAYQHWLAPVTKTIEAALSCGCDTSAAGNLDEYSQLVTELKVWAEQLSLWRKRLNEPKPAPAPSTAGTSDLAPSKQQFNLPIQAALDGLSKLTPFLTALKGALETLTTGAPDKQKGPGRTQKELKRELVALVLRHPSAPSLASRWEDWLDEVVRLNTGHSANEKALKDNYPLLLALIMAGAGAARPEYILKLKQQMQVLRLPKLTKDTILVKWIDPVAGDVFLAAINEYLRVVNEGAGKAWVPEELSTIRNSTLSLLSLVYLIFAPSHEQRPGEPDTLGTLSEERGGVPSSGHGHAYHTSWTRPSTRARARVTVIGGGIAGLTAAHELIERGFDVQVVEKMTELGPDGARLALGGVARTQWSVLPNPDPELGPDRMVRAWPSAGPGTHTIYFQPDRTTSVPRAPAELVQGLLSFLSQMLRAWDGEARDTHPGGPQLAIEIRGHACPFCKRGNEDVAARRHARFCWAILAALSRPYAKSFTRARIKSARLVNFAATCPVTIHPHEHDATDCRNERVELCVVPHVYDEPGKRRRLSVPTVGHQDRDRHRASFIPGEHGYRFFPSFYRHLRDTMSRTPLYDEHGQETHRTTHDNLVPTYTQVFARAGSSLEFARSRPRTLESFRSQLRLALVDLKFDRRDLQRFATRILRYLSTSRARREAVYEDLSWWDFLTLKDIDPRWHGDPDAPRCAYSSEFERQLKAAPQALVAMDAEFCDARTQGNIVLQLLLDQFLGSEYTDSTLNGPTTAAWIDHWRRHLRAMGVRFYEGEIVDFAQSDTAENDLIAKWGGGRNGVPWPFAATEDQPGYDQSVDYYVLAVDVVAAEQITRTLAPRRHDSGCGLDRPGKAAGGVIFDLREYTTYIPSRRDLRLARARRDVYRRPIFRRPDDESETVTDSWKELYERYEDLPLWEPHPSWAITRTGTMRDTKNPVYGRNPTDRLQTFSGVQFYFGDDFQVARGHAYFQETPWGLSAISQMQFWTHKQKYRQEGIRGILSVDVGSFYTISAYLRLPAHRVDSKHLSEEVWRQVQESLRRGQEERVPQERTSLPLPQPYAYHIDDWLHFVPSVGSSKGFTTTTPFLVNNVGDWGNRPGAEPWDPAHPRKSPHRSATPQVWQAVHGGYQVHFKKLVFAGSYTKTFTRMTTMEAANESARHAVNAILDHVNSPEGRTRLLGRILSRRNADALARAKVEAMQKTGEFLAESNDGSQGHLADPLSSKHFAEFYEQEITKNLAYDLAQFDAAIVSGDYCKIWDPERHELEELEFLRRVDDMLFEAGKPHMFDILGVDDLVDRASPESDPLEALLMAIGTTVQRDWDLGSIKDGGGLKLLREMGEKLRQAFTDLRARKT